MSGSIIALMLQAAAVAGTPVPDSELALQRGGLRLPNGIDIAVTVQTQTAVNGGVVLQTVYKVDEGAPTLAISVPSAGETVPLPQSAQGAQAGAVTRSPTVSFDRTNGLQVTPAVSTPAVALAMGSGKPAGATQQGLTQASAGTVTDFGVVTENAGNGVRSVSLTAADLTITHLAGNAFGTAIVNSGNDRVIDSQTTISIDLGNFSPDTLGSAMFRVQDIALDAVALRTGG